MAAFRMYGVCGRWIDGQHVRLCSIRTRLFATAGWMDGWMDEERKTGGVAAVSDLADLTIRNRPVKNRENKKMTALLPRSSKPQQFYSSWGLDLRAAALQERPLHQQNGPTRDAAGSRTHE